MIETNLPYAVHELDGAAIQIRNNIPVSPEQAVEFRSGTIKVRNGVGWIIIEKDGSPTLEIPFSRVGGVVKRDGLERSFYTLADFKELNLNTH